MMMNHTISDSASALANHWLLRSDKRFKTDIDSIGNALKMITQLRGVYYKMDTTKIFPVMQYRIDTLTLDTIYYHAPFDTSRKVGFLAQDVEKVLPEVVSIDNAGYYSMDYARVTAVLVEGMKVLAKQDSVQDTKIQQLDSVNTAQDSLINKLSQLRQTDSITNKAQDSTIQGLSSRLAQLENLVSECCKKKEYKKMNDAGDSSSNKSAPTHSTIVELSSENSIILNQNDPNPFAERTSITYFLPDDVQNAKIVFYDNMGKIIKTIEVTERGNGVLQVYASNLSSGIYTYSILVDGQVIDTKKMVVAK